jgi:hypothetical protein
VPNWGNVRRVRLMPHEFAARSGERPCKSVSLDGVCSIR